jgi:hypothetical protein
MTTSIYNNKQSYGSKQKARAENVKLNIIVSACYVDWVVPLKISSFEPITQADIYESLKSYCLENTLLLNRKQRDYCLKRLAKRVKQAQRKPELSETDLRLLIGEVVDYLYEDELRNYQESNYSKKHIFVAVKKLNDYLGVKR